jgi:membrane protein insertase Oxa1/YidC/SpoIIIJ
LRDMLKDQASGKEIDQAEVSAAVTGKMIWLFPVLTFAVSIYLAGALVVYLLSQSAVAVVQQWLVLRKDKEDLEKISQKTKNRADMAQEAEVVSKRPKKKRRK